MNQENNVVMGFRDLRVYQLAFNSSMKIFELTKKWPKEEKYSATDQIRRASRSVCANIAESWRKRRYPAHFVSMPIRKLLKREYGLILGTSVDIWQKRIKKI